ncbi:NAD(P)/FAD-dependent oxidoreductase [Thermomonas carbonis]|uniref:FAD-binding oxidoreductase n=1 Tax=Thermomonas carbonis TaxID=1463158 RepID=A0A7G9SQJ2_9GAMM|nr:FAD-dependent oxidoreductase [Thermomonas carbonis]QNN70117.1 FAD-binding oxidoreductase [Thermomonas carbonis]GHB97875.1 oxidoreductase [Thermomonas carbonis]
MDLKSGYPFWAIKNGLMHAFPPLQQDIRCDVAIIGGGITGALIADELASHGHDVAVLDQRDIGWGSTAASTALLQYEIDTHMVDLAKQYGEDNAVLAYQACAEAIDLIAAKAADIKDVDFGRMSSLYYASKRRNRGDLEDEFALRKRHGFDMRWLDADQVQSDYGFKAPCAILSAKAARVDPYRMAYRLLMRLHERGAAVHDRTTIARIEVDDRSATLTTTDGATIKAKYLVMAAGYASQQFLRKRVAKNRSSYAFITEPIDPDVLGALKDTMVWESARPYLYIRSTGDGRLLVGGDDDSIDIPAKRDALVDRKARKLADKVAKLFPDVPVEPAFAWAGTFAETDDGLPWIGASPEHSRRLLFAMAYGGNGITYSMLGAGLIRALVERRKHPLQQLFGFQRKG